jgi:hypothetical protein
MKIRANRRIGDLDSIYLKINIVTRWGYFLFQNIWQLITKTRVFWIRMAVGRIRIRYYIYRSAITYTDPLLYVRTRILPSALEGCTKYTL